MKNCPRPSLQCSSKSFIQAIVQAIVAVVVTPTIVRTVDRTSRKFVTAPVGRDNGLSSGATPSRRTVRSCAPAATCTLRNTPLTIASFGAGRSSGSDSGANGAVIGVRDLSWPRTAGDARHTAARRVHWRIATLTLLPEIIA